MNRLIIFLVSEMLLLTGGARAEEIYLNCKFINGFHKEKNGTILSMSKDPLTDATIILDTRKEKIKKGPFLPDNEKLIIWSKTNVIWSNQIGKSSTYKINIDRNTGALTIENYNPYVAGTINYKCNRESNVKF